MGETAREFGYIGPFPFDSPEESLKWGCEKFARCIANSKGDMIAALQRYNGGGNLDYAKQVIAKSVNYS